MFLSFLEGKFPEPSLARNLDDLRRLVQTLTERGVCVEFIKKNLTFTGEASPMAT
jgi:DNA invertase Pin-like site-specific DNA recombinase